MTIADAFRSSSPAPSNRHGTFRRLMNTALTQNEDRDVSTYNLPLGKIAAVVAVIVTVVWWAATLTTDVGSISKTLGVMQDDVSVAAGLAKDLKSQEEKYKELSTEYRLLEIRVRQLETDVGVQQRLRQEGR